MIFVWCAVFIVCNGLRTTYEILGYKGTKPRSFKFLSRVMAPIMILLWISWFVLCDADSHRAGFPAWLSRTGLVLFLIGTALFITALFQLKGFYGPGRLITGGLFRKLRHPMYLGFCLWLIGYPLFSDAITGLILAVPGLVNVFIWRFYEDRMLGQIYHEYEAYRAGTWF